MNTFLWIIAILFLVWVTVRFLKEYKAEIKEELKEEIKDELNLDSREYDTEGDFSEIDDDDSESEQNHYTFQESQDRATLGVSYNATMKEVKAAYSKLIKQYHPDKRGDDIVRFSEINAAYKRLATISRRRKK